MQKGFSVALVFLVVSLLLVFSAYFSYKQNFQNIRGIHSFEDCAKAGYPVFESYPGQCNTPDGQHFVQPLSEEEKKKLVLPTPIVDNCSKINNLKVDSQLIQLYSSEDPEKFAADAGISLVNGKVRIIIETEGEVDLSNISGFIDEASSSNLIQGMVSIKELCKVSNLHNVKFVRLPSKSVPVTNGCKIGGCSGQLCMEGDEQIGGICDYQKEYGCYKKTKCERQVNGKCGWTNTPELNACLEDARKNPDF